MSRRRRFSPRALLRWPGILLPAVLIAAGGSAGGWLASRPAAATPAYSLVAATRTNLNRTLATTGTIEPATTSTLSFSAPGQVTAVDVTVGQHVTGGQTLATMSSPALQEQLARAAATLDSDQGQLAQDEDDGAPGAQLTADQATVSADQSQVDSARQALAGLTLTSPTDGIVTSVGYTSGEQVGGSAGAGGADSGGADSGGADSGSTGAGSGGSSDSITVISTSDVVDASVAAAVVSEIRAGDRAVITTSGAAPAPGTVASVGLIADTTSGVATFPVTVAVTGTPHGLYAGASASVSIVYQQVTAALVVPAAAVRPGRPGHGTVRVMAGGRPVTRQVATGITASGLTQITSGLSAGDRVVVNLVRLGSGSGSSGPVIVGPGGGKVQVIGPGGGG